MLSILELNGYVVAYTAHADVCAKVKKGEKEGFQHVSAQTPRGVFASACAQIHVALPDSYL